MRHRLGFPLINCFSCTVKHVQFTIPTGIQRKHIALGPLEQLNWADSYKFAQYYSPCSSKPIYTAAECCTRARISERPIRNIYLLTSLKHDLIKHLFYETHDEYRRREKYIWFLSWISNNAVLHQCLLVHCPKLNFFSLVFLFLRPEDAHSLKMIDTAQVNKLAVEKVSELIRFVLYTSGSFPTLQWGLREIFN